MTNTVTAPSLEERSVLLMQHLLSISDAIVRTRQEIAELRQEQEAGRARDELQDVIEGTEQATNTILTAAETVATLAVRLGGAPRTRRPRRRRSDPGADANRVRGL